MNKKEKLEKYTKLVCNFFELNLDMHYWRKSLKDDPNISEEEINSAGADGYELAINNGIKKQRNATKVIFGNDAS